MVFKPLVMTNIAIENGHLQWIVALTMVIVHSYVKLPEGIKRCSIQFVVNHFVYHITL